jgi:Holliday junction resolvase-like predicted endonuclease
MITITRRSGDDPLVFDIVAGDAAGASRHRVTVSRADVARLAGGRAPERLIEAAFRFLLEREPKESILARFDVSVIARYFPEFERELPRYFADGE